MWAHVDHLCNKTNECKGAKKCNCTEQNRDGKRCNQKGSQKNRGHQTHTPKTAKPKRAQKQTSNSQTNHTKPPPMLLTLKTLPEKGEKNRDELRLQLCRHAQGSAKACQVLFFFLGRRAQQVIAVAGKLVRVEEAVQCAEQITH